MGRSLVHIPIDDTLQLRLVREEDAPELFRLVQGNRTYLRRWLPWLDFTRTVDDEVAFIQKILDQYEINNSPTCVILDRGQIAGMIGYHQIDWANRKGELGYWLAEQFQGQGLMTRACQGMLAYGFEILGLNKIEIRCATGNTRSCAVPQRLGFTQEGVVRQGEWLYDHFIDLVLFGLLVSEWKEFNTRR